jgi:hypothetical protein
MKRKLLYLTAVLLFSVEFISAQTTKWDFANNVVSLNGGPDITTDWPNPTAGATVTTVKNGLGIVPGAGVTTFAAISNGSVLTYSDGYSPTNRLTTGGASTVVSNLPSTRYFYFEVSGACQIKVWARGGGANARATNISDGTNLLSTKPTTASTLDIHDINVTAAGRYYIYADGAGGGTFNKIEVIGATVSTPTLSTDDFQTESSLVVYGNEGKISISNVISATKISVYSISGVLVKSTEVNGDESLSVKSGVYIVKSKSAEGEKSVKVLVN